MSLAKQRWKLLMESLLSKRCGELDRNKASLRRFQSFALINCSVYENEKTILDTSGIWQKYTWTEMPDVQLNIRHLNSEVTNEILLGFNNTGNICIWPAEEVMSYYLLKHPQICRGKRVCELGGGMTCLAGMAVAVGIEAKHVLLSDGNERSADNIQKIIDMNSSNFKAPEVAARCLKWNQCDDLGDLGNTFDLVICADCLFFDDERSDLAHTIHSLLNSEGEAIIFAPQRSGTFQKFEEKAATLFDSVERLTQYDPHVWQLHQQMLETQRDVYDDNIHYPWLLRLANKRNVTTACMSHT